MPTPDELEAKLWAGIRSEMTVMLGTESDHAPARPMTAIVDGDEDRGPLWFFTSQDSELMRAGGGPATAMYVAKGHDLFARIEGVLREDTDPAMIDRLWNPFVAAWYDGKDDPDIALMRMDLDSAEIWENASSLIAGIKSLFGRKPQQDYKDKVAQVPLE
ncbi:pyridoxamine 5'-phosphate oxidase family protein [Tabrizicola sp. BL-A-41-H6]|uniref:pyridoxamine 5'-phosphate oxidase family protein n=1 Tax=Tabrizicola sp. BL-A-41-H6 TaxID=3421107 RepID=UPI003D67C978